MKLSRESKIKVLENFYGVDYILFGKPLKKMPSCCPLIKEDYLSTKGALMSIVAEMYELMGHSPKVISETIDSKRLMSGAVKRAKQARSLSLELITSKKGKTAVQRIVRESVAKKKVKNLNNLIKKTITEKTYALALDSLLVATAIVESKKIKKLNTWEGRIIEDAYKIMRTSLIESAKLILKNTK